MRLRTASIVCVVVLLVCLASLPVIDYAGGRACMPLNIRLFPAGIVPFGIGFVAVLILLAKAVLSLVKRRDRCWTFGALAVSIAAIAACRGVASRLPGFHEGLRDRFVAQVGYPKMREFAKEVSAGSPLTNSDGVFRRSGQHKPLSAEEQKAWNDLVARYPFLAWNDASGGVVAGGGIVELTWGSPLTGHWGFQVCPGGAVKELTDAEDRGASLKVAEDIQFVYYWD
jgi:hypothetical protein